MKDYKLVLLGTSSGLPQADRATSGYLVQCGDDLSVIDCGSGVISAFLKLKYNPLHINRVFISHTHPDHVCELPLLIQLVHLSGKITPLEIYLPDEFVTPFKNMMAAMYLFEEKFEFDLQIYGYTDGYLFTDPFSLTAISNDHLLGYKDIIKKKKYPNKMQSHSFLMNINGKKILYSGDVVSCDEIQTFMNGCDYVLIESTHCSLEHLLNVAMDVEVGKFILTHLGDETSVKITRRALAENEIKNIVLSHERMILFL